MVPSINTSHRWLYEHPFSNASKHQVVSDSQSSDLYRLTEQDLPTVHLCRTFSTSSICLNRAPKIKPSFRRRRDPWMLEQARAKKAANLSRQEVLKKQRKEQLGDPLRGIETEFVRSFDNPPRDETSADGTLNFFVKPSELEKGIAQSKWLLTPTEAEEAADHPSNFKIHTTKNERKQDWAEEQDNAAEALRRINNLSLGSSKDKLRVNIQRCIGTFGRHNTDATLPPKLTALDASNIGAEGTMPRIGQDTGSSEVQIGILTAKIRILTKFIEGRGRMDRHNRRNLQVLVHKRQKLLKYLSKKEKGGPRWQNLVEKLGLTDGTWKGEITIPRYLA